MSTKIATRSIEECERIVELYDSGQLEKVRRMFGGAMPSAHFLDSFRAQAIRGPEPEIQPKAKRRKRQK